MQPRLRRHFCLLVYLFKVKGSGSNKTGSDTSLVHKQVLLLAGTAYVHVVYVDPEIASNNPLLLLKSYHLLIIIREPVSKLSPIGVVRCSSNSVVIPNSRCYSGVGCLF
jgi:predicted acyltransferase